MTWIWITIAALIIAWVVAWSRERRRADRRRDILKDWQPSRDRGTFHYDPPKPHPRAGYGNDGVEQ